MTYSTAPLTYRRAALQHASVVGLVIALHDTLIGDLQRAAIAIEQENIQSRCDELAHGFKVLTQLDAMLDVKNGGEKALQIRRFYNHLRKQMMAAQFKLESAILHAQVIAILEVRDAWQQVDESALESGAAPRPSAAVYANAEILEEASVQRTSFSCSG